MTSRFLRDNIAGNVGGTALSLFLLPGKIIQWSMYMFPSGNYAAVRHQTRLARSPLMTFVYSIVCWAALAWMLLGSN